MARTDWKKIAYALADRVQMAMDHCDFRQSSGTGTIRNNASGESRWWRDYMAEGIEMIPGLEVDREVLEAIDLPAKERRKAFARIRQQRQQTKGTETKEEI